jgi:hypothetical protein
MLLRFSECVKYLQDLKWDYALPFEYHYPFIFNPDNSQIELYHSSCDTISKSYQQFLEAVPTLS